MGAALAPFLSAFVLLDALISAKLYRGEPDNPNFRFLYAINRFRGKWELRIGLAVAFVSAAILMVGLFI